MNSRPTPYQGVALPLRYSGSATSGQRPNAVAIAYETHQGKSRKPAMSTKSSDREKRRAAALRANLNRRKAAARKRSGTASMALGPTPGRASMRPNEGEKHD